MLIRFVVSNFLSFYEEREFNMISGAFKTHKHHVYKNGKIDVLKAAAIYGANGAGKSNLIKAMHYLKELVVEGEINKSIEDKKFKLNIVNKEKPVTFEIEFQIEKKIYSYGIAIEDSIINHEWLYESGITADDKLIFERKSFKSQKTSIKIAKKYQKTQKDKLLIELMEDNLLKNNELLISKTESLKKKEITEAQNWIENNLLIIYPHSKFSGLVQMISNSDRFQLFANQLLSAFDTGINQLGTKVLDLDKFLGEEYKDLKNELIEDINKDKDKKILMHTDSEAVIITKEKNKYVVKKVISFHKNSSGKNIQFNLDEESDGTQRLLDFIPAFDAIINDEITIVIDEIDHSLHPALLKTLVHKIMSDESTKGQLIFTTHESNLLNLDIFRQDEIWFVEKDKKIGSTELYSLSEFKPRYDLDIRKGYLKGRFGAIPFMANLLDLNWHDYEEEEKL